MDTFTEEQKIELENKTHYIALKEKYLKQYKVLANELEYAMDDVEAGLAENKRQKLAAEIKILSQKLRDIEAMENLA